MLKRFTLSFTLAILASVSILAKIAWEGSNELGSDWDGKEVTLDLTGIQADDILRIHVSEPSAFVKVVANQAWDCWAEGNASDGVLDITVTQEQLDKQNNAGIEWSSAPFKIEGQNFTFTKIELIQDGEPIGPDEPDDTFSGVAEIQGLNGDLTGQWSGVPDHPDFPTSLTGLVWVKPAYMPGLQKGDAVNVYFEKDGGQGQFFYRNAANDGWVKAGDNGDASGYWDNIQASHTYTFPVNSDAILASLLEYGLYIDGHDNTVVKVEFVYKKHPEEVGEIKADGYTPDIPDDPEGDYTTRVLWETGMEIESVNGTATELVLGNTWLSRVDKGDQDPDDLSQAFHIPAIKFFPNNDNETRENSDLDDCIVVTFSQVGEGAEASFYFQDNEGVWFKRGVGGSDDVADSFRPDHAGKYERYILNYRTVAALRTHGLYIDGHNATISKVELRNYNNAALSDEHPYFIGKPKQDVGAGVDLQRGYNVTDPTTAAIDWETNRRIRPVAFQNYVNGERIVLIFNKTADDPQLRLDYIRPYSSQMRTAQGLTGTTEGIATSFTPYDEKDGKERVAIVYRPTQREIRALKHNGLFLSGQGLELSEITFGLAKSDDQTQDLWIHNDWMTFGHSGDEGKIYEGDVYHSGQVKIYISNIHFKRAQDLNWLAQQNGQYDGYKLTFYFPWAGDNASMTLSYDSSNVYDSNRDPLNMYYAAAYPTPAAGQAPMRAEGDPESGIYVENQTIPSGERQFVDVPLESDHVQKMINYGLWLEGKDADLQNIYLRSPMSVSATDEVEEEINLTDTCVDFNQPYEAYTLDGRRVADIEAPGLYIVRQGNKVQKIIRR